MVIPQWGAVRPLCTLVLCSRAALARLAVGCLLFLTTLAAYAADPEVSLEMTVGTVVSNGYNTYMAPVTISVANIGRTDLQNVQLINDLDIFGQGGHALAVEALRSSGANLALNRNFDGLAESGLLRGTDTLAAGASATISYEVTFDHGRWSGPFSNKVVLSATSAKNNKSVYASASAHITLPLRPEIDYSKTTGDVVPNGDGTYTVPITLDLLNIGEEDIERLQLKDDLDIFGSGRVTEIGEVEVLAGDLNLNPGYNGLDDVRLLAGDDVVAIGDRVTVRFAVTFDPGSEPGPFTNWSIAWTAGATSQIGIDIGASALIELPPGPPPAVALQKTAGEVALNEDNYHTVTFELDLTNTGMEDLVDLELTDSLDIFGTGNLVEDPLVEVLRGDLSLNENYNGIDDVALLDGTDRLPSGANARLRVYLVFDPADEPGRFTNEARLSAVGAQTDIPVSAESSATFPRLRNPGIRIENEVIDVADNEDGSFTAQIRLTVTNTGDEDLNTVQLIHNLDVFGPDAEVEITEIDSDEFSLNETYDGVDDIDVIDGSDELPRGESGVVELSVRFTPTVPDDAFPTDATTNGIGVLSGRVTDASDDALIPVERGNPVEGTFVSVTKTAERPNVVRGDIAAYEVIIANLTVQPLGTVATVDLPPAGFNFEAGPVEFTRAGTDGVFDTGDDTDATLNAANSAQLIVFEDFDLAPRERVRIRYATRVSTGVANGEHTNVVTVTPLMLESISDTATVVVQSDAMFEQATLIGKVFYDRNPNFEQDECAPGIPQDECQTGIDQDAYEPGIPGVRLATTSGLVIETDAEGRFHLAAVEVARFERGENFILKLDQASLPDDMYVASENPRVLRLTQGMMSKMNFAIRRRERTPTPEYCDLECVDMTLRRVRSKLAPVRFRSGESVIPDNYRVQIQEELDRYSTEQQATLVFVGHADSDPVVKNGRLAARLNAYGEDGNVILSENRAKEVCRFVTAQLGIEQDCENSEGRGSSQRLSKDNSEAQKRLDRRVEIEIEYLEISQDPASLQSSKVMCPAGDAEQTLFSAPTVVGATNRVCKFVQPRIEQAPPDAIARHVTVSGGRFGCNRIVAEELLPGRGLHFGRFEDSAVTVFEEENPDVSTVDCPTGIVAGEFPIEVSTEANSILRVTSAGDVIRHRDADNEEFIVVTPFRDDTDTTIVSALRISNEGIEPGYPNRFDLVDGRERPGEPPSVYDSFGIEPRLDVLDFGSAEVDSAGYLSSARFAAYTNYAPFIERYAIDLYGVPGNGGVREYLLSIHTNDIGFGRALELTAGSVCVAPYDELEYEMRAMACDSNDGAGDANCYTDVTHPRLLTLRREATATDSQCTVHPQSAAENFAQNFSSHRNPGTNVERGKPANLVANVSGHDKLYLKTLWGKSNLAQQRIPIIGGRLRRTNLDPPEPADLHDLDIAEIAPVDAELFGAEFVPVGAKKKYVFETHHAIDQFAESVDEALAVDVVNKLIPAHANGLSVSGGLFGDPRPIGATMPGRVQKHDPLPGALTVVAELCDTTSASLPCDVDFLQLSYPIVVTTYEGTEIHVTAAGDVLHERHPPEDENRQAIVVTPFRDYTKNSVVSALRIANEGVEATESERVPVVNATQDSEVELPDYSFLVAYANLTIGQNNVSGNQALLSADPHFDGSTFADGRLAVYAKRRFNGKYMFTGQLDTTEDELRSLGDNLRRKDPRRLFRQLDSNHYYAIYGDDSTTSTDVDTQGAMYLRLDWNKNTALWGNYNTGLTGTEFGQYNRSLYGAKFRHESQATTAFGDSKTELSLFGSEAQSVAAHVTFQATGGSLYYLRNTDIVEGSEKVWIEVRRRNTEQVVEREILFEGRDYEVDALQGRIILSRPLSQIVAERDAAIIRSTPLEGDDVFLLVDYEYVPFDFNADDLTFGGRGRLWLGDHVGLGTTAVVDERNGADYDMQGLDLTLKHSERTYLKLEFASSQARQNNANFFSVDGGLSFQSQVGVAPGDSLSGDAFGAEARLDLADFSAGMKGDVRLWSKQRDAEFSTGRLGQGLDINDRGVTSQLTFGAVDISASYTDLEHEQSLREKVARIQAETRVDAFTAGFEVRHEDVEVFAVNPLVPVSALNGASGSGEALLLGARIGYDINDKNTVYAAAQTVADDRGDYRENDLVTLGINRQVNDQLAVSVEGSDGDRGSAMTAGVDYATAAGLNFNLSGGVGSGAISQFGTRYSIAEGHELYGSYTVDPDRTFGARNLLTLGQRRAFGNSLSLFTESQFGKHDLYANVAHVFGLEFDGIEDWRFSASMQFGENNSRGIDFERRALSLGAFLQRDNLKLSSRVELREDDGIGLQSKQYVSSNSFTKISNSDRRWLGQLNFSWTDDELNGGRDARFAEFELGHAMRPANNDRLNVLAKYSYLYDLPSEGQATARPDERSHLFAVDALYDLSSKWELGGKFALRKGERRATRDAGPWREFGQRLFAARARYHLTRKWDGLVEYRWLSDIDGANTRHGALLGVYYHVGDNMKIGAGFNFTDFNDELRFDDYRSSGWFIDLVGKH